MMKNSKTITLHIESLSHEGRGVARDQGKTTFVDYALPGETVCAHILNKKSQFNEAKAVDIQTPSPYRIEPRCRHYGQCGACSLQHMGSQLQLELKQSAVSELLTHHANCQPQQWLPPLTASPFGYRRKARFSVKYVQKKQKVLVGFREKQGRFVADLSECHILSNDVGRLLTPMSDCITKLSVYRHVPQIEVIGSDNETALIFRHLQPFTNNDIDVLREFAITHQVRVYCQPAGKDSIQPLHPPDALPLHYEIAQHRIRFEYHPVHFIQVNQAINIKMIDQALSLLELKETDQVIDLFCGIGNFSLPMARYCQHVVGVEGDTTAITQAQHNATINDLKNTEFYYTNLFENVYNKEWGNRKYNKVLLDPPRAGAQEIIPTLVKWEPERIVYVSCNPATLARDIGLLTASGYQLVQCGILDMFPQTKHVETMALLTRET